MSNGELLYDRYCKKVCGFAAVSKFSIIYLKFESCNLFLSEGLLQCLNLFIQNCVEMSTFFFHETFTLNYNRNLLSFITGLISQ